MTFINSGLTNKQNINFDNKASQILKKRPLNIMLLLKTKNFINSKTYFFFIACSKGHIMIYINKISTSHRIYANGGKNYHH